MSFDFAHYVRKEGDEPRALAFVERCLIGCLILDCGLRIYARGLRPDDFSNKHRSLVFQHIMDADGPVDLAILAEIMESERVASPTGKYWGEYLASFLDNIPDVENVSEYARIVRVASIGRRLKERGQGVRTLTL